MYQVVVGGVNFDISVTFDKKVEKHEVFLNCVSSSYFVQHNISDRQQMNCSSNINVRI